MKRYLWPFGIALLLASITAATQTPFHWQWRAMDHNFWQRPILRQMKINNDDRVAMTDAVTASLKADHETFIDIPDAQLWDIAANESYEWVDLDGDGVPELVAEAFGVDACGGVGNCVLQVFRRRGSKLELILYSRAESLMVDRSGSKPLLVLYEHESAIKGHLAVYQFPKGRKAALVKHYGVTWAPIPTGSPAYSQPHLEALPLTH